MKFCKRSWHSSTYVIWKFGKIESVAMSYLVLVVKKIQFPFFLFFPCYFCFWRYHLIFRRQIVQTVDVGGITAENIIIWFLSNRTKHSSGSTCENWDQRLVLIFDVSCGHSQEFRTRTTVGVEAVFQITTTSLQIICSLFPKYRGNRRSIARYRSNGLCIVSLDESLNCRSAGCGVWIYLRTNYFLFLSFKR